MSPSSSTWHYRLLWLLVLVSLLINGLLVAGILGFRAQARQQVEQASASLQELTLEEYQLAVDIDETLPLSMTIPFSDTFLVPISATIPVSTSVLFEDNIEVPINTIIPVNTTVNVPVVIPAVGEVTIPIPISTNIPVNLTVNVPISREIPVRTDIPVNLMVDVPVQSEVPVRGEIPVQLEFPVSIPLNEMGGEAILGQVQQALDSLLELLGGE